MTILAATLALPLPLAAEPHYRTRADGWFWYHTQPVAVKAIKPEPPPPTAISYQQQLTSFQDEVQESLARAILEPAPQHLQHYMRLNAKSLAMSGHFADAWQLQLQQQPSLDYRLRYPASDQALQSFNYYSAKQSDSRLRELAGEYGLWFMFRSDCPVCHRFAPVLRGFSERYGFSVLAVSLDGGILPDFPQPKFDTGIAEKLEVDLVPALFLVAPKQRSFNAVGYGYMSAEMLRQRLLQAVDGDNNYRQDSDAS